MATIQLGYISEQNFEAFRRIFDGNIASPHSAWQYLFSKRVAELQGGGNTIELVEVDPNEFTAYCARIKIKADAHSLNGFAHEKATGKIK